MHLFYPPNRGDYRSVAADGETFGGWKQGFGLPIKNSLADSSTICNHDRHEEKTVLAAKHRKTMVAAHPMDFWSSPCWEDMPMSNNSGRSLLGL